MFFFNGKWCNHHAFHLVPNNVIIYFASSKISSEDAKHRMTPPLPNLHTSHHIISHHITSHHITSLGHPLHRSQHSTPTVHPATIPYTRHNRTPSTSHTFTLAHYQNKLPTTTRHTYHSFSHAHIATTTYHTYVSHPIYTTHFPKNSNPSARLHCKDTQLIQNKAITTSTKDWPPPVTLTVLWVTTTSISIMFHNTSDTTHARNFDTVPKRNPRNHSTYTALYPISLHT